MPFGNYSQLQTAITTWLVRPDLSTQQIQDFITLGESKLNRGTMLLQQEQLSTVTLTQNTQTISLPSDFLEIFPEGLKWQDVTYWPIQKNLADVADLALLTAARPEYFAITSNIVFERPADKTYTLSLRYRNRWNIASSSTNWLLTNAPDAYLYASLDAAGVFARKPPAQIADTESQLTWGQLLDVVLKELNSVDQRSRKLATKSVDPGLLSYRRTTAFNIIRGY